MTEVRADPLDLLRTRTSEKWLAYPADVLPLFVAEMDYPLAPVIADAIVDRVRASDTGYVAGSLPVGIAFAGFAARRWGWDVDPGSVMTTTDVSVGIVEILRQVTAPGDGVVICPPVYPPFFDLIPEAGARVVEVPLLDDGGAWSLDLQGIEAAFAAGARAFLLCNPHNPVGLVHSRASLEAVSVLAARYGVTVVSDEIHGPLTLSLAEFIPYLTVSDAAREHGLVVTSASKAFNLAGLKCALMVAASERGRAVLAAMPVEVLIRTSLLGQHASVAAFTHGDDWLDGTLTALETGSALLGSLLASTLPGVVFRPPGASYLAWLDFRPLGWGEDPSIRALKAGVALNAGPTFGAQGRGFARLNFACAPDVLTEAIRRLALVG
ncbi:MAG: cysteine-S-conjugate beta-lyase [Actinomycetota bacterium]|nr:cysteine-S-conjugate beta-lyase [Actinomycetota bacterium]